MAGKGRKIFPSKAGSINFTKAELPENVQALERIARLLAVLATRNLSQKDQVAVLRAAGFTPLEIADIIGTTSHQVSVIMHQLKQAKSKRQKTVAQEKE